MSQQTGSEKIILIQIFFSHEINEQLSDTGLTVGRCIFNDIDIMILFIRYLT